jgi:hypothetical protein
MALVPPVTQQGGFHLNKKTSPECKHLKIKTMIT